MKRRKSLPVWIGKVMVGGDAPIRVQSMTNTKTCDVVSTVVQIKELVEAGCEIVRVAVPDRNAALALKEIRKQVDIPLVADIHFNYHLALKAIEAGVDGLRINPGNIGGRERLAQLVDAAKERGIPIRIGVNAGSLEKDLLAKYGGVSADALVESALNHIRIFEELNFREIKVSLKASNIPLMLEAYHKLAKMVDYPFHVGVTEAGPLRSGVIKSAVGIGALLAEGIGDTIRVSLTDHPRYEVWAGYEILKALGLRQRGAELISCPTCGRCKLDLISIAKQVEDRLQGIKKPLKVAVMGCVVNGPGEAREADIGIAGGKGFGLIFHQGKVIRKVPEENLVEELMKEIEEL